MRNDDVGIKETCKVDWRKMTAADGGRFCGDCKKVVRDLSRMSEREAGALLHGPEARAGELCVRYVYDRDGRIVFAKDARSAIVPASFLLRARRAAAVALPLALAACSGGSPVGHSADSVEVDPNNPDYQQNMGGAPAPQDPPDLDQPDAAADARADAAHDGGLGGGDGDSGADAGDGSTHF